MCTKSHISKKLQHACFYFKHIQSWGDYICTHEHTTPSHIMYTCTQDYPFFEEIAKQYDTQDSLVAYR